MMSRMVGTRAGANLTAVVLALLLVGCAAVFSSCKAEEEEVAEAEGKVSLVVTCAEWPDEASRVRVNIKGEKRDGGEEVEQSVAMKVGEEKELDLDPGTYTFSVSKSSLSAGDVTFKAGEETFAYDGMEDHLVTIAMVRDAVSPSASASPTPTATPKSTASPSPSAKASSSPTASATATPTPTANPEEITVYVTATGKKYHRDGCRTLTNTARAITKAEALESGYEPCGVCNPDR